MRFALYLPLLALALLCASPAAGQPTPPTGATIRGAVVDSLTGTAGIPLADATVQLVAVNAPTPYTRTVTSDAAGGFAFTDVPAGRYLIGFLHPVLDSLGLEQIRRTISVAGKDMRVDLAIPPPVRARYAYCDAGADGQTGGVIIGFVRAAHGRAPESDATVTGEWLELSLSGGRVVHRTVRRSATTGSDGGFALCDLPTPGTVLLRASRGASNTDRIEIDVPAYGFLRRDLYLGEERLAERADSAAAPDSLPGGSVVRTGPGRLRGTVVMSGADWPVPGAEVAVVEGETVQAGARGAWTLSDVPSGTRLIEVRAPDYFPKRIAVDIIDGAPPVQLAVSRYAGVLDTLHVVAQARSSLATSGFEYRQRASGTGRFLSAVDIARRRPWYTSDLFDMIPGLQRDRATDTFTMRAPFGDGWCVPAVFINGMMMRGLSADQVDMVAPVSQAELPPTRDPRDGQIDINLLVRPGEIVAMEVYTLAVPPQFQDPMSGCGSIVFWTK